MGVMTPEQEACGHEDFDARVDVHRLTDGDDGPTVSVLAEVTVWCSKCLVPFRFLGVPLGVHLRGIGASVDRTELRVAIAPGPDLIPDVGRYSVVVGGRGTPS